MNQNAFPIPGLHQHEEFNGMSLLDYFAAKALQPLLLEYLQDASKNGFDAGWKEGIANDSYTIGKAMLSERQRLSDAKNF